ncbi:MAG: hypothetical protein GF331_01180 [Chitinivibrionales bacterium]|nr:hypothetical protein [Chitinivibrionales bacterium]
MHSIVSHAKTMALTLACCVVTAGAVTVTVDPSVEYQTIEGFGGFGLNLITTQSYLDKIIGDLGVTMIRTNTADAAQSVDDWANFVNAVKARADALGEPMRFIASTWSPPAHMKVNNSVDGLDPNTNKLRPENYDDYGEVVKTFLQQMKTKTGIDYYGVSFQNEPAFPEPYWSCVYTAQEYRDMIKAAAPIVKQAFPNILVFGAEDMLANWTVNPYAGFCQADPVARELLNVFAVHGYSDGVHPTPASGAVRKWQLAGQNCLQAGKPLWMTETSGYPSNWDGAFELAEMIYAALKHGKLAAWVWWTIAGRGDEYYLMDGETPTQKYYTSKNFYRYIRPGAVMVDALSDDSLVFSVGFHHKQNRTLSLVLLNANSSARTVTISGDNLPTFHRYLTTSSINCEGQGTTGAANIQLPAKSVTSLYGENYNPSVAVSRPHNRHTRPRPRPNASVATRWYTLTGQKVRQVSPRAGAAGVMIARQASSKWLSVEGMTRGAGGR